MKYKVLHVFGKLNRGGSETFIMNVLRTIDREQYQFDFLVHDKPHAQHDYTAEVVKLGCKIYSVPSIFRFPIYLYRLFCLFRKSEHNIVHIHIHTLALFPLLFAKFFGKKVIVHSHSTAFGGSFLKKIFKYLLSRPVTFLADYLCACGLEAGQWLYGKKVTDKKNFSIITNGIDTDIFKYDLTLRKEYRKKIQLEDKLVLGHVGSFATVKNHTFLIDIFNQVYKQNNNAVLLLIGRGPLEEEVKNKVNSLGLTSVVQFLGVRDDIPALMNAMDILVFPSLHEGLPVTLVEAQATGLPCLVSNTVSEEAKITNQCTFIPLNDINQWVEACLAKHGIRENGAQAISQSGYSVESSSKKLSVIYKNFYKTP